MRCTTCGEFVSKGRKFNAKKETNFEERYLSIQVYFFHIKCTRCSAEITFRTDPKNCDYAMVKGAVRNMEPWRNRITEEETMEQRLGRLELEEAEEAGEEEKNAMADLEAKNADARREMAVADALDETRHRNARIDRSEKEGVDYADMIVRAEEEERARQDREDTETARQAFRRKRLAAAQEKLEKRWTVEPWQPAAKKKVNSPARLGIKIVKEPLVDHAVKKKPLAAKKKPVKEKLVKEKPLVDYTSD